jgi:hypothetical protein
MRVELADLVVTILEKCLSGNDLQLMKEVCQQVCQLADLLADPGCINPPVGGCKSVGRPAE